MMKKSRMVIAAALCLLTVLTLFSACNYLPRDAVLGGLDCAALETEGREAFKIFATSTEDGRAEVEILPRRLYIFLPDGRAIAGLEDETTGEFVMYEPIYVYFTKGDKFYFCTTKRKDGQLAEKKDWTVVSVFDIVDGFPQLDGKFQQVETDYPHVIQEEEITWDAFMDLVREKVG